MVQRHGDQQRIRVLFLAANPDTSLRLRLDREVRRIEEKLRAGTGGGALDLVTRWAVRPDDLQQAMLKVRPGIVHFSCHGTEAEEIVLEDEAGAARCVGKEVLARLFGVLKDEIRVVFLNACHSRSQAEAITRHVDCAIGMRRGVGDVAAIAFAAAFYQALAFGRSVREAFDLGLITLELEGISRDAAPELLLREGVDAEQLYVYQRRRGPRLALPPLAPSDGPVSCEVPRLPEFVSGYRDSGAPVRPSRRELPPWIGRFSVLLAVVVLLVGVGLNLFLTARVDRCALLQGWLDDIARALMALPAELPSSPAPWPPGAPVNVLLVLPTAGDHDAFARSAVEQLGGREEKVFAVRDDSSGTSTLDASLLSPGPGGHVFLQVEDRWAALSLEFEYKPQSAAGPGLRQRYETGFIALQGAWTAMLAPVLALSVAAWSAVVTMYRRRRLADYRKAEQMYIERISGATALVEQAAATAEAEGLAQALIKINQALALAPTLPEALEFKRRINEGLRSEEIREPVTKATMLYLRVIGTPHAYRAPDDTARVTIGRQRRKTGRGPDEGNDIIIRVAGDDQSSLRISRRHLEIQRIGRSYIAIDRSLGATELNGERMPHAQPVLVRSGDRFTLAAVISLEFVVTTSTYSGVVQPAVRIDAPGASSDIIIQASLGDMLTVHDDYDNS